MSSPSESTGTVPRILRAGEVITLEFQRDATLRQDSTVHAVQREGPVRYTVLLDPEEQIVSITVMPPAHAALRDATRTGERTLPVEQVGANEALIAWGPLVGVVSYSFRDRVDLYERERDGALVGIKVHDADRLLDLGSSQGGLVEQ